MSTDLIKLSCVFDVVLRSGCVADAQLAGRSEADGVAALSMKTSAAAIEDALDAIVLGFAPRQMVETKNPFAIP